MLLTFFEPVSFAEGMIKLFLIFAVLGVTGMVVGFFLLKVLAQVINSRRDSWEETAQTLGLETQHEYVRLVKPLKGVYRNFEIEVSQESPDGENAYATWKAKLRKPLPYVMEIATQNFFQRIAESLFDNGEIKVGIEGFDKSFSVSGSDKADIQRLLSVHLPDGKVPNLIVELLSLKKSGYLIKVTDTEVQLQKRESSLDISEIQPVVDAAIHLVERIEKAQEKSREEQRTIKKSDA